MKKIKLFICIALVLLFSCLFGACEQSETKKYSVTFETYSLASVQAQTVEENKTATKPQEPESETHTFVGWYVDEGFSTKFDFSTPITKNTTIYAKWVEKESTYTVKFDNQGKGKKVASQYIDAGTNGKITKPDDLSSKGWVFKGWSLKADGKDELIDFETYIPKYSITLYAQWNELFTVSFDLNNEEALYPAPNAQEIECGCAPIAVDVLPVSGYVFNGWYTMASGGEKVDVSKTTIAQDTVFYAQWDKNAKDTIDYDAPYTDNKEEAGFGDNPDLAGFVIDGKMNIDEEWEEQVWYETATLDKNKVTLSITTKFSEKGLYIFAKIKDDNGINFVDRYYSDRNSNLLLYVTAGDNSVYNNFLVRSYRVDSDSLYPCDEYVKVAPYMAEGKVNSQESATLQVEAFLLWSELQLESMPQSVKINPVYNYKTNDVTSNLLNAKMGITLSNVSSKNLDEYAVFDKNGYVKNNVEPQILGGFVSGVAMSEGWDVEYENAENNAYVSPKTDTKKAIFFKNIDNESYFAQTTINPESFESSGKAGVIIYNNDYDYSAIVININESVYNKATKSFSKYVMSHIACVNNVVRTTSIFEQIVDNKQAIDLNVLYANNCLYVQVDGKTVSVIHVDELKGKKTAVGLYSEGCKGLKFSSYSARAYTAEEGMAEARNYAYLLSVGKLRNLTIELDKNWLSATDEDKMVTLTLAGSNLALTATQRNKIKSNGVTGSGVKLYRIDKLFMTVNGVDNDITSILNQVPSDGKYDLDYTFKGNGAMYNTSVQVQESELVACVFNLVDENGNKVNATAKITTSYPYLNNYTMAIISGDGVLVLPKGYQSKVTISQEGYNDIVLILDGTEDKITLDEIKFVANK